VVIDAGSRGTTMLHGFYGSSNARLTFFDTQ